MGRNRRGLPAVVVCKDDTHAACDQPARLVLVASARGRELTVEQLREGADWVNQQINDGQRVLIHCEHGVGRSVLLTAASLVASGMSAHDAMQLIQRKRWQAAPNHRQMRRLQAFEQAIRGDGTDGEKAVSCGDGRSCQRWGY